MKYSLINELQSCWYLNATVKHYFKKMIIISNCLYYAIWCLCSSFHHLTCWCIIIHLISWLLSCMSDVRLTVHDFIIFFTDLFLCVYLFTYFFCDCSQEVHYCKVLLTLKDMNNADFFLQFCKILDWLERSQETLNEHIWRLPHMLIFVMRRFFNICLAYFGFFVYYLLYY